MFSLLRRRAQQIRRMELVIFINPVPRRKTKLYHQIPIRGFAKRDGGSGLVLKIPRNFLSPIDQKEKANSLSFFIPRSNALPIGVKTQHSKIRESGLDQFDINDEYIFFSLKNTVRIINFTRSYILIPNDLGVRGLSSAIPGFLANESVLLAESIEKAWNTSNTIISNLFGQTLKAIEAFRIHGASIRGKTVCIPGIGYKPFAAYPFLLEGAAKVVCNDIREIEREFDTQSYEAAETLLNLFNSEKQRVGRVSGVEAKERGELQLLGNQGFENVQIAEDSIDLLFTVSVLEHVKEVENFIEKTFTSLKPGGLAYHSVDLRDHRNFNKPLAFLYETSMEYQIVNTENRLRASQFIDQFTKRGFEIIEMRNRVPIETFDEGTYVHEKYEFYDAKVNSPERISIETRDKMDEKFRIFSLSDLSIVGIEILMRKPLL